MRLLRSVWMPEPHTTKGAAARNVYRGFLIGLIMIAMKGCH